MAPNKKSTSIASYNNEKKRKRTVLTLLQKIDICKRLDEGENRSILMKDYNIGSSTIYDIKAQKEQLFKFYAETASDNAVDKRKTLTKPKLEQLDTQLYEWFQLKRSEGKSVSGAMLIEKAIEFYKEMNLTEYCSFSHGWLGRFKLRHGIRRIDLFDERKPIDVDAAEKYCETFGSLINKHNLTAEQIYSADEINFFWRCVPSSTLIRSKEFNVAFKRNKDRVTVLICANSAGTHKLKLLIVGKYSLPKALRGVARLPVIYKNSSWMDKEIFHEWFHHNFVLDVKEHFKKIGLPEDSKAVLLLDKCRVHSDESELASGNIFTTYLPANVISLIQPVSQGILQNMIFYYRRDFLKKLVNHHGTVEHFQEKFNIKDAIYGLASAWRAVKNTALRMAWKKLWPYVVFSEASSDEEEFEGFTIQPMRTVPLILDIVQNASSSNPVINLQEEDIRTWLDTDLNTKVTYRVSEAEIIDNALNPKPPAIQENSEDLSEVNISWATAANHLKKFITFAQTSSCYSEQEMIQLHNIQSSFQKKRKDATKKEEVINFLEFVSACLMDSKVRQKSSGEVLSSTSNATSIVVEIEPEALEMLTGDLSVQNATSSTSLSSESSSDSIS